MPEPRIEPEIVLGLSRDVAVRFLGAHARLVQLASAEGLRDRARALVARLEAATSEADAESIAREIRAGGDARDVDLLRAIAGTVRWGESFGLSEGERADEWRDAPRRLVRSLQVLDRLE